MRFICWCRKNIGSSRVIKGCEESRVLDAPSVKCGPIRQFGSAEAGGLSFQMQSEWFQALAHL